MLDKKTKSCCNVVSFGFIGVLDSKQTFWKVIASAIECATVTAFTFPVWQRRSYLLSQTDLRTIAY